MLFKDRDDPFPRVFAGGRDGLLSAATCRMFRGALYRAARACAREFPWRETTDPYHILVSELMLQQTQTDRVLPKYVSFLRTFPSPYALAAAPLPHVLAAWQGLGYNRRALALHRAAQQIVTDWDGVIPAEIERLDSLPGVGYHTAAAVCAYAFNQPVVYIETNIRSVYLHAFFRAEQHVPDSRITPLVAQTLDRRNPRRWYGALMDVGAALKKRVGNAARRSAHYTRQSRFEGSDRQVRGGILRALLRVDQPQTERGLATALGVTCERLRPILEQLIREGFVARSGSRIGLHSRPPRARG